MFGKNLFGPDGEVDLLFACLEGVDVVSDDRGGFVFPGQRRARAPEQGESGEEDDEGQEGDFF